MPGDECGGVSYRIEASDKHVDPVTLVLLPGLDGTGNLFADFIAALPRAVNVIPVADPPQRFVPYADLVRWLSEIVPKQAPFAIVAESYGTPLAVKFAATHPSNLVGIVLSAGFISNPVRRWGPLPKLFARPLFFRIRPPDFLHEYFIVGRRAHQNLKLALRRTVGSVNAEVLAKRARASIECDARREILQVKVPLLYLQAAEDRLVGKECLDEIKRLHPETISISFRAPHLVLQREPHETAKTIIQFLETQCGLENLRSESSSAA